MNAPVRHQYKNEYEYRVRFDRDGDPDFPQYETFTIEAIDSTEALDGLEAAAECEIETFYDDETTWEATLIDVH